MADRDALLGAIKAAYRGALGATPSAGFIERQKSALAGGSSAAVLIEDIFASGTYASRLNRRAQTEDRAI